MLRLVSVFSLLVLFSGCGSSGKPAAIVNGQVITVEEVDRRMAHLNPMVRSSFGNDPNRVLEQMIMETVLLQEARRRGLNRDTEVVHLMQDARRQILFGRLLEVLRDEGPSTVTDAQVREYYEKNPERFIQPEEYRASHILVSDEETAKKALARIKSGEPFAKVAQELSTDPSKTRGGDIGFFSAGQVIPEFEQATRKLKPGDVSDVVKTPLGYHVIFLTERRASGRKSFEEVEKDIRALLENQQRQQRVESVVQELRGKAQIQIREGVLPKSPASAPASQPAPSQSPTS